MSYSMKLSKLTVLKLGSKVINRKVTATSQSFAVLRSIASISLFDSLSR